MVDMAFQFSLKSALNRLAGSTPPLLATAASVMAMAILITERHGHTASCCAAYAAAFFAMALLGHNFWYDYGIQIGALLVLVTMCKASDTARDKASAMHILIKAALLVGLMALFARETPTVSPLISNIIRSVPQTPDSRDLESISEFVRNAPPGTKIDMGYSGIEGFFLTFNNRVRPFRFPGGASPRHTSNAKMMYAFFVMAPAFRLTLACLTRRHTKDKATILTVTLIGLKVRRRHEKKERRDSDSQSICYLTCTGRTHIRRKPRFFHKNKRHFWLLVWYRNFFCDLRLSHREIINTAICE